MGRVYSILGGSDCVIRGPDTSRSLHVAVLTLLPVPHADGLAAADLFLQLKDSIEQSLCRRRAARYIDIHRNNPVTATHHCV